MITWNRDPLGTVETPQDCQLGKEVTRKGKWSVCRVCKEIFNLMFYVGWLFLNAGPLKWNGFFRKVVSSLKLDVFQHYVAALLVECRKNYPSIKSNEWLYSFISKFPANSKILWFINLSQMPVAYTVKCDINLYMANNILLKSQYVVLGKTFWWTGITKIFKAIIFTNRMTWSPNKGEMAFLLYNDI